MFRFKLVGLALFGLSTLLAAVPLAAQSSEVTIRELVSGQDRFCRWFPRIHGDLVAYELNDYLHPNTLGYIDLASQGEERIPTGDYTALLPAMGENGVIAFEHQNAIYVFHKTTGLTAPLTGNSEEYSPSIAGSKVAYLAGTAPEVFVTDFVSGQTIQVTNNGNYKAQPDIDGNRVVWSEYRDENYDIYMYDLLLGQEKRVTSDAAGQIAPRISGDDIVYLDNRNDGLWDIYLFDLTANIERQLTSTAADEQNVSISNGRLAWEESGYKSRVLFKDLVNGDTITLSGDFFADQPDVYYDSAANIARVVWRDGRDGPGTSIFLAEIIGPTPASTPTPIPTPTVTPTTTPLTPDLADYVAPATNVTYPLNGSTLQAGRAVNITADASDNVAIARVEFYLNKKLKCRDTAAPYSCSWKIRASRKNRRFTLQTKAYNIAGSVGRSSPVIVTSRRLSKGAKGRSAK